MFGIMAVLFLAPKIPVESIREYARRKWAGK